MRVSKGWSTIALVVFILVAVELVLQVRAQFRYGNSIFAGMLKEFGAKDSEKLFKFDQNLDQFILTPNIVHSSKKIVTKTNSLGLRSPEIGLEKADNEFRFIVIGASTIQGAGSETNQDLFSYKLHSILAEVYSDKKISFINAGIAGYKVENQFKLFDRVLRKYQPDLVIVYTGVNNFEDLCSTGIDERENSGLPGLSLPKWVLSYELLVKNTTWSRPSNKNRSLIYPEDVDAERYRVQVKKLIESIVSNDAHAYVLGSAKSYRKEMPKEKQQELSALSTYYYSCLNLELLYFAYSKFNTVLKDVTKEFPNAEYIETENILGGGEKFFIDPVHFTAFGESALANSVAKIVLSDGLVSGEEKLSQKRIK